MKEKITVIINAYNEEKSLPACLESLQTQTRLPDEILVVENGSTDNTVSIAKKGGAKVYSIPRCTRGEARDYGWRKAKGSIVVYGDADDTFSKNWLQDIEKKFAEGYDAVIDRIQVWNPDTFFTRSLDAFYAARAANFTPVLAWGFRKKTLEKMGGFLPTWLEEAELGIRLQKGGVVIGHASNAFRYHHGKPRQFRDLISREYFFGQHEYRDIMSRHPSHRRLAKFWISTLMLLSITLLAALGFWGIVPIVAGFVSIGLFLRVIASNGPVGKMPLRYQLGNALSGTISFWIWPMGVWRAFLSSLRLNGLKEWNILLSPSGNGAIHD